MTAPDEICALPYQLDTDRPAWAQRPASLDDGYLHGDQGWRAFSWLGTHEVSWLGRRDLADIPWFVSRRRLMRRQQWPQAQGVWAMDSGAFTEASMYGQWTCSVDEYVEFVRRAAGEVGNLAWAAPMDLCCEPGVVDKVAAAGWLAGQVKLPLNAPQDEVLRHNIWTVRNFIELRTKLDRPDDPLIIPVVQGWTMDQYCWCLELYEMAGVDLTSEPLVGIGSTCRRDADMSVLAMVAMMGEAGIHRIHAFGVKGSAVPLVSHRVSSVDSMAWSYSARRRPGRVPGCEAGHVKCNNCPAGARRWRDGQSLRADQLISRWRTTSALMWASVVDGTWDLEGSIDERDLGDDRAAEG